MTPLHIATGKNSLEMVSLLLDHGADIEAKDNDGWTPLRIAAVEHSLDMARLLIENDASTDGIDLSWMNEPPGDAVLELPF